MKLHLPKLLLTALLATFVASPLVWAEEQDGADLVNQSVSQTFSGDRNNEIVVTGYDDNDTITFALTSTSQNSNQNWFGENNSDQETAASIVIGDGVAANANTVGLIINNGNGDTTYYQDTLFTGSVTGSGIIKRIGGGDGTSFIFAGDMTGYTGNIYLGTGPDVDFNLVFGGKTVAVDASDTTDTKGIAGTGTITIANALDKVIFNYSPSDNPVYITNTISEEEGGVNGSTLTLKGGASYKFTKDVNVDNLILEGGSALTISGGKVNSLVSTNGGMVNVTGGEVILAGQANAIGEAGLTISNATVSASASFDSDQSIIHNNATVNINAGGKLELKGHDVVGWNSKQDAAEFILAGESKDKLAELDIVETGNGTTTLGTLITMKGHTLFSGKNLNTWGAAFTVEGTNNTVDVDGLFLRKELTIKIESGGELTLAGSLGAHGEAASNSGSITKTGAGLLNLTASLSENFALPITIAEGGLSSDYFGVVLTGGTNDEKAVRNNLIFDTAEADAVIKTTGAGYILLKTDEYTLADGGHVLQKNYKVDGNFSINGKGYEYQGGKRTFSVGSGKSFTTTGALSVVSRAELLISGGSVTADSLQLGHNQANNKNGTVNPGYLTMTGGNLTIGTITYGKDPNSGNSPLTNVVDITGGTVEFTTDTALTRGQNTASTINITGTSADAPVVLKATKADWTLDGSGLTTAPTLGNIKVDAGNTYAITLKNVALSGSVVNNATLNVDGTVTLNNVALSGNKVTLESAARATVQNMTDISTLLTQLDGSGTLVLTGDAYIAGVGADTINTANPNTTVYDFAGNIEVTGGVLKLADNRDSGHSNMNSLSLEDATITLKGGSLRYFGGNSTLGCVDVDADATLDVYATNGGASASGTLTIKELDIASGKTLTLSGQWDKNVALDALTGEGKLKITAAGAYNVGSMKIATLEAAKGNINFAAGQHEVEMLDISSQGNSSVAQINLKEKAQLDVKATLWMGSQASINLEDGASLTKGVVNIEGLSTENKATFKKATSGGAMYSAGSDDFIITGAAVSVKSDSTVTLGNNLQNSKVINAGVGELKLTHASNVLSAIEALAGDINLESLKDQSLESLYIGDELSVNTNGATLSIQEAAINQQGARVTNVTFGDNAKLQGNLVLQSGAALSLGKIVQIDGTLTLGNDMTLTGAQLEEIKALKKHVELFHKVDQLKLTDALARSGAAVDYTQAQDLSHFFSNVDSGVYLLEFDSGVVYATLIPEPATGTMSLLALAALAARRRRRH